MNQCTLNLTFRKIVLLVLLFSFGVLMAQPEVNSEPTAETEIICYAAEKQWVCAPADQKQQAHDKAMKLAQQDQSAEIEPENIDDNPVEIKTMNANPDFSQQVQESPVDQLFRPGLIEQQINDFVPRDDAKAMNQSETEETNGTGHTEDIAAHDQNQITTDQANNNEMVAFIPQPEKPIKSSNNFTDWQDKHFEKWSFQVVGAANRNQLDDFISQHNLQQRNYAIAKTQVNAADWWIVLVGLYNSRDEALSQRSQ